MGSVRSFTDFSRLRDYDASQNTIVNYIGTHYVRILKRFDAPANYVRGSIEAQLLKRKYNRTFHLRFYIPKATLVSRHARVRQVVMMFNGLNEVDRFDLYDVLGEHLAEQGIAAVVLPTPYHLNRSAQLRRRSQPREPPHVALFQRPMLMYYNYKQSMLESDLLIRKLTHKAPDEGDYGFYESVFDAKPQISILGFSLGGLRALASFTNAPSQYHTCIVFNSGVALSMLNTELIRIGKPDWDGFVARLHSEAREYAGRVARAEKGLWETFEMVFLGNDLFELRNRLKEHSQRLLFILSGADSTVPPDISVLEVEGHGLNVFRVAGVGHIPTLDPKWSFWIDRVAELIGRFVEESGQQIWSRQRIVSAVATALAKQESAMALAQQDGDVGALQLGELLKFVDSEKRVEATEAYYASMAYYPRFREVLKEVVKSFERTGGAS